ncbi:alpha/beta fold hydrolase [Bailinhaonella thermotolerans]|uniref:Alpha/beta hydrolase n=1 Tax=Bailinhaonella thermotolerans TaxID=1070861 RepID=A0A3A4BAI6_9ACTN|nr:alpha/beta hydrolase [Bailinhaonella thermotolerans]RJL31208.1 alpha/beta hydrolase [Bailinhaonella thermotolerans]
MRTVTSRDGTPIAYERLGEGPPVVLIGGGPSTHESELPLARELAGGFSVYVYDRRGRGESGFTEPHSADREFEDLAAVIGAAGGSACVYGSSGLGSMALEAAARGLPITRVAAWEPPYVVGDARPPVPADWGARVAGMIAEGRRGDALEYWMTEVVLVPAEYIGPMRGQPFWTAMEEHAQGLVYDAAVLGDFTMPRELLAGMRTPALVGVGGSIPWLATGVRELAKVIPDCTLVSLPDEPHDIPPQAIAPVLTKFFAS